VEGLPHEDRVGRTVRKGDLLRRSWQDVALELGAHLHVGLDGDDGREDFTQRARQIAGARREVENRCVRPEPELDRGALDRSAGIGRPGPRVCLGHATERRTGSALLNQRRPGERRGSP
jgi:hypothetical protein